jgi:hypothetical protein
MLLRFGVSVVNPERLANPEFSSLSAMRCFR